MIADQTNRNTRNLNFLALVKGEERYVFVFSDACVGEVKRTFGRFASDKELSFTWYDAAVLSDRVNKIAEGIGAS